MHGHILSPSTIMSRSQEEKEKFFAELFKLDELANDSDPEPDSHVPLKPAKVGVRNSNTGEVFGSTSTRRLNSASSGVKKSDKPHSSLAVAAGEPNNMPRTQSVKTGEPPRKRRKKEKEIELLPEKDRVFPDQVFCK